MGTPHRFNAWNAPPSAPVIDPEKYIGKKPNKVIPVPYEYRRQTLAREGDILKNNLRIDANCHVMLKWDQGKIIAFDVYGAGADVERGVSQINRWISQAHVKSKDSSAWAKIPAYVSDDWYYEQIETIQNNRKLLFKGPIPPFDHPDAPTDTIVVKWPRVLSEELLYPRDVFGNKLERLDTLRMQDEVWFNLGQDDDVMQVAQPLLNIIFLQLRFKLTVPSKYAPSNHKGNWEITIEGHGHAHVELARDHLVAHLDQVRTETSGMSYACNVILDNTEGIHVELQQNEDWWPNQVDRVVPRLLPSSLMDEPGTYRQSQEGLSPVHQQLVHNAIQLALDKVRGRKGSYDFAVRLGCIALKAQHVSEDKIGQTFKKEVFLKDIDGKVELDVKKWLANDDAGYRLLLRFMERDDVFEPTRSGGYFGLQPKTLKDTRPTFRGTWVFRDPNSAVSTPREAPRHSGRPVPMGQSKTQEIAAPSPASLFVIELDWSEDEEGQYEKGTPRYFKLEAGKLGLKKNIEINLLELGESRGWHFALESKVPVPDKVVPPILKGFAERVVMRPDYKIDSSESFAQWEATPTVKQHLVTGRLDSVYMFGIKGTDYKAELTAMWYPNTQPVKIKSGIMYRQSSQNKPVWGLFVRHLDWASHLAELECLPIGSRASWDDTMATFFPEDEQLSLDALSLEDNRVSTGLSILTKKLLEISDVVSSVTDEGGVGI